MHKIDSDGATVLFRFTEGSVPLVIPATVVSAAWLNAVQGELVTFIEALGITLDTSVADGEDQLYEAARELIRRGGRASPVSQTIANNQASAADVTSFPVFLSTEALALEVLYRVFRRTDTSHVQEVGRLYIEWDSEASAYTLSKQAAFDESNVTFSVLATGNPNEYKLQYTSDNMAGASYAGSLKLTDIKVIRA